VSALEGEIGRMRSQSDALRRRMKGAAERHEAEQSTTSRTMAQLKKEAEAQARRRAPAPMF